MSTNTNIIRPRKPDTYYSGISGNLPLPRNGTEPFLEPWKTTQLTSLWRRHEHFCSWFALWRYGLFLAGPWLENARPNACKKWPNIIPRRPLLLTDAWPDSNTFSAPVPFSSFAFALMVNVHTVAASLGGSVAQANCPSLALLLSEELGELSPWLCYDDNIINVVMSVIIIFYTVLYLLYPRSWKQKLKQQSLEISVLFLDQQIYRWLR